MTQVELADYLGLRRTYISDLERGKRNVTLLTLEIIARGFGLFCIAIAQENLKSSHQKPIASPLQNTKAIC